MHKNAAWEQVIARLPRNPAPISTGQAGELHIMRHLVDTATLATVYDTIDRPVSRVELAGELYMRWVNQRENELPPLTLAGYAVLYSALGYADGYYILCAPTDLVALDVRAAVAVAMQPAACVAVAA